MGGGEGTRQCQQRTQGGGSGFAEVSRDFFSKFLSVIFIFWPVFIGFKTVFLEK
jgi:hypothetical protein